MALYQPGILKVNGVTIGTYTDPFNVDVIDNHSNLSGEYTAIKKIEMVDRGSGTPCPIFPRIQLKDDSYIWFTGRATNRPFYSYYNGFNYINPFELLPNFQIRITGNNTGGHHNISWYYNWGSPLILNISDYVTAEEYSKLTGRYRVLVWR